MKAARSASGGGLVLVLFTVSAVRAQEPTGDVRDEARPELGASVRFRAPPECIDEVTLVERTSKSVRPELVDPEREVEGRVTRDGDEHFSVDFDVTRAGEAIGRRHLEFDTSDCRTLDESLELVLAMLLEGNTSGMKRAPSEPAEAPTPDEEPPPPVEEKPQPVLQLGAAARLFVGVTPTVVVGPWLDGRLRLAPWFTLGLSGGYLPASAAEESGGGSRVVIQGGSASVEGCVRAIPRTVALFGCLGAGLLTLRGAGEEVDNAASPRFTTAFGDASLRLEGPLVGPLYFWVGARVLVPVTSATFQVMGAGGSPIPLFSTADVWGAFDLGLGLPL